MSEATVERLADSVFGEVLLLRCCDGPALALPQTLLLTTAARAALLAHADQPPRQVLTGHTAEGQPSQQLHVALFPLADVGHALARGLLQGLSLVLPRELDARGSDRHHVLRALAGVRRLTMGAAGAWEVERLRGASALVTAPYVGPARVWASVTPVVCDHFPKPRPGRDARALVIGACERIGLPRPLRVDIGRDAWLPGVPSCLDFRTERHADLPPRYRTHCRLEFAGPVQGPLLLGAGRYFGLGLCRALA